MTRPTLEVADILRAHGDRFLDRYRSLVTPLFSPSWSHIRLTKAPARRNRRLRGKNQDRHLTPSNIFQRLPAESAN